MWNGIYKGINEPFVVYVVSCFVQLTSLSWDMHGERTNNVLMLLTLVVILLFPFWTAALLLRNKDRLKTQEFKSLYI